MQKWTKNLSQAVAKLVTPKNQLVNEEESISAKGIPTDPLDGARLEVETLYRLSISICCCLKWWKGILEKLAENHQQPLSKLIKLLNKENQFYQAEDCPAHKLPPSLSDCIALCPFMISYESIIDHVVECACEDQSLLQHTLEALQQVILELERCNRKFQERQRIFDNFLSSKLRLTKIKKELSNLTEAMINVVDSESKLAECTSRRSLDDDKDESNHTTTLSDTLPMPYHNADNSDGAHKFDEMTALVHEIERLSRKVGQLKASFKSINHQVRDIIPGLLSRSREMYNNSILVFFTSQRRIFGYFGESIGVLNDIGTSLTEKMAGANIGGNSALSSTGENKHLLKLNLPSNLLSENTNGIKFNRAKMVTTGLLRTQRTCESMSIGAMGTSSADSEYSCNETSRNETAESIAGEMASNLDQVEEEMLNVCLQSNPPDDLMMFSGQQRSLSGGAWLQASVRKQNNKVVSVKGRGGYKHQNRPSVCTANDISNSIGTDVNAAKGYLSERSTPAATESSGRRKKQLATTSTGPSSPTIIDSWFIPSNTPPPPPVRQENAFTLFNK